MRRPPAVLAAAAAAALLPLPGAARSTPPSAAERGDARWRWPLAGSVARAFDLPAAPWLPGHRGVDLAGSAGAVVRAAGPGVVAFAGPVAGVGVVSVRHAGGLLTTYQPVEADVAAGDRVAAGTVLGRLSAEGSHCAPGACLHWGLRRGEDYLDPLLLLGRFTVRLVPLDGSGSAPEP